MSFRSLLPSLAHSLPSASSSRPLSTSTAVSARQAFRNRPKRDQTTYGIPAARLESQGNGEAAQVVETSDKHPLWKFFHDGESLEVPDRRKDNTGRSWTAMELRRKSFNDLHELWYICLRERNVLLTQREEARRLRVDFAGFTNHPERLRMVQKTMARIKQVLSERKHAALEAAEILRMKGLNDEADKLLKSSDVPPAAV